MKKHRSLTFLVSVLLMLLYSVSVWGQDEKPRGFFEKLGDKIARYNESRIDTNYLVYPTRKLLLQLSSKNAWSGNKIYLPYNYGKEGEKLFEQIPDIVDYEHLKVCNNTFVSGIGLDVDYMGLALGYAVNVTQQGVKQSFELGTNGNAFGITLGVSRHRLDDATVHNYLFMPAEILIFYVQEGKPYDIKEIAKKYVTHGYEGMEDVTTWYANAYYAFNGKKFSMSAVYAPDIIQKRSAGSFFVSGDVSYVRLHTSGILQGDKENFNSFLVAVGGGYGYNWTPNSGRLVAHASVAPMISVYSRFSHESYLEGEKMEEKEYFSAINDKKMKLTLSARARLGMSYNISERMVAGFYSQYLLRNSRNASDSSIRSWYLQANAYVGYRF